MNNINDDLVIKEIQAGNLSIAQKSIEILELKLLKEKLKYNQRILRERIERLKSYFSSSTVKNTINEICLKEPICLELQKSMDSLESIEIRAQKNNIINIQNSPQIIVVDCENIKTSYFECYESLSIRRTKNSKFICQVKQIRLFQCENIDLCIFTETGVYIEECKGVRISKLNDASENLYDQVFDFDEGDEKNYEVLD